MFKLEIKRIFLDDFNILCPWSEADLRYVEHLCRRAKTFSEDNYFFPSYAVVWRTSRSASAWL